MLLSKNLYHLPVNGRCEAPSPNMTPLNPPLTQCIRVCSTYTYSHREVGGGGGGGWGELTREEVRGAKVHKAGRKYQHN
jgi:hypothetical protein